MVSFVLESEVTFLLLDKALKEGRFKYEFSNFVHDPSKDLIGFYGGFGYIKQVNTYSGSKKKAHKTSKNVFY